MGIAFQSLKHEDAENIGYIIPTPVIQHFITDYERNGAYTGFPCLGVEWQKMENPDMRRALKMKVCLFLFCTISHFSLMWPQGG